MTNTYVVEVYYHDNISYNENISAIDPTSAAGLIWQKLEDDYILDDRYAAVARNLTLLVMNKEGQRWSFRIELLNERKKAVVKMFFNQLNHLPKETVMRVFEGELSIRQARG